jgi:hypothetical protein
MHLGITGLTNYDYIVVDLILFRVKNLAGPFNDFAKRETATE